MTKFAEGTSVPVEKSRAEIEKMIIRYGATETGFYNSSDKAAIMFHCSGRQIRFVLPLPSQDSEQFKRDGRGEKPVQYRRAAWENECRRRWRALALVIKAKLEAVESGITTFEDEFLAHIVLPEGGTVGEHIRPRIAAMYETGNMVPLLPPPA